MRLLEERVEPGSLVFVVGGEGIVSELEKRGFRVTRSAEDASRRGGAGIRPRGRLARARRGVVRAERARRTRRREAGIPWIATNMDWTIPVARGIAPGNGTLVSAVHTAVGRFPRGRGQARDADLRGGEAPVRRRTPARRRRPPRHRHPRRQPRGNGECRRAHRHRSREAGARGRRGESARLHPRRPARAPRAVPGRRGGARRCGARRGRSRAHRRPPGRDRSQRATTASTCCAPPARRSGSRAPRSTRWTCRRCSTPEASGCMRSATGSAGRGSVGRVSSDDEGREPRRHRSDDVDGCRGRSVDRRGRRAATDADDTHRRDHRRAPRHRVDSRSPSARPATRPSPTGCVPSSSSPTRRAGRADDARTAARRRAGRARPGTIPHPRRDAHRRRGRLRRRATRS